MADSIPIAPAIPSGGGGLPITPEVAQAMGKLIKDTVAAIYNQPPAWYKGEATGMKNEFNGIVTAFQAVKAEWTAFKFEPPSIWEVIQNRRARARGEAPDQLLDLGKSAKKLATDAKTAADKANQAVAGAQTVRQSRLDDDAVRNKVNTAVREVNLRISRVRADLEASIQRASQKTRAGAGQDSAAAIREEGRKTRKAVTDLENAVKGAAPAMNQFKQRLDSIEQALR